MKSSIGWRRFCDRAPEAGSMILCKGECLTGTNVFIVYAVKNDISPNTDPSLSAPDITLHSWIYLSEVEMLIRKQAMITTQ
jgi:hypothetical protein